MNETLDWETSIDGDVKILRLWLKGMQPGWPRVVILDLTSEKLMELERDVLAFDKKYKLYPDQPIQRVSGVARMEFGGDLPPLPPEPLLWRVVMVHRPKSIVTYTACPHD
jgi:hypothetical protein